MASKCFGLIDLVLCGPHLKLKQFCVDNHKFLQCLVEYEIFEILIGHFGLEVKSLLIRTPYSSFECLVSMLFCICILVCSVLVCGCFVQAQVNWFS